MSAVGLSLRLDPLYVHQGAVEDETLVRNALTSRDMRKPRVRPAKLVHWLLRPTLGEAY